MHADAAIPPHGASTAPPAEIVLRNAHIITVDGRGSIAQAIAIADGKMLAVGADADMATHHRAANAPLRHEGPHHRAGPDRRPCPHGPRGASAHLPVARPGPLDQGHPGSHRRARARQEAGRVDRHHADRRSAVLLRRARDSGREALADAAGARRGGAGQPGLHPFDLGLLARHVAARLLRQHRGAEARRHHARHRLAAAVGRRSRRTATAIRPACLSRRLCSACGAALVPRGGELFRTRTG